MIDFERYAVAKANETWAVLVFRPSGSDQITRGYRTRKDLKLLVESALTAESSEPRISDCAL